MVGLTVTLYEKTQTGIDPMGAPIYTTEPVIVKNVLIGEPQADDIATAPDLREKKIQYMIGIPKGDLHDWTDSVVEWTDVYGLHKCRTFGPMITGVEANIPTPWHKKIRAEWYE